MLGTEIAYKLDELFWRNNKSTFALDRFHHDTSDCFRSNSRNKEVFKVFLDFLNIICYRHLTRFLKQIWKRSLIYLWSKGTETKFIWFYLTRHSHRHICSSMKPAGKRNNSLSFRIASCNLYCIFYRFSRSEEHTSELQSRGHLVCRLLLE